MNSLFYSGRRKTLAKNLQFVDAPSRLRHDRADRLQVNERLHKADIWIEAVEQAKRIRSMKLSQFDPIHKLQETLRASISIYRKEFRSPLPSREVALLLRPLPVIYNLKGETMLQVGTGAVASLPLKTHLATAQVGRFYLQHNPATSNSTYETIRNIDVPVSQHSEFPYDSSQFSRTTHYQSSTFKARDVLCEKKHSFITKLYTTIPSHSTRCVPQKTVPLSFSMGSDDRAPQNSTHFEDIFLSSNLWIMTPRTIEDSEPSNYFDSQDGVEDMKGTPWNDLLREKVTEQGKNNLASIRQRAFSEAPSMGSSFSAGDSTEAKPPQMSPNTDEVQNTQSTKDEFFSFRAGSPDSDFQSSRLF